MKKTIQLLYQWFLKFLSNIKNWLEGNDEKPPETIITSENVRSELRLISKPLREFIEEMNHLVKKGFVPMTETLQVTYNPKWGEEVYHMFVKQSAMGLAKKR